MQLFVTASPRQRPLFSVAPRVFRGSTSNSTLSMPLTSRLHLCSPFRRSTLQSPVRQSEQKPLRSSPVLSTMSAAQGQVCDFRLAPGGTTGAGGDAHTHSHEASGANGAPAHAHSHSMGANEHGHTHELMEHPGKFKERAVPDHSNRDWNERAFTVGIGG